jgi:hypothetical protein
LGLPSPPPFPQPLFPLPPDFATAVEVRDVDNNNEIAGGVTTANLPQAAKKIAGLRGPLKPLLSLSLSPAEKPIQNKPFSAHSLDRF